MNLHDLMRIDKLPHFSSLSAERLLTKLTLYERVLISTKDVKLVQSQDTDDVPCVQVSPDVKALHAFCESEKKIMLPCAGCHEDRPFSQEKAWNPHNTLSVGGCRKPKGNCVSPQGCVPKVAIASTSPDEETDQHFNVFDQRPPRPHYNWGNNILASIDHSNFFDYSWDVYADECAHQCKMGILAHASEMRKDFVCTLDQAHEAFFDFLIFPAVTSKPNEMADYWLRQQEAKAKDPDAVLSKTPDEQLAEDLYNKHSNSLLLIKVGQYPSLSDIKLFDAKKYRSILGKKHGDYTLALALYADGIGAGAFVYLRRIMESLVEEIHQACVKECNEKVSAGTGTPFDEIAYTRLRFNEKIDYLEKEFSKKIIPDELNDIRGLIYGVISKGVHELSEEDCLYLFPAAQFIIDSLIEEKIQQREKQERLTAIKKQFSAIGN